MAGRRPRNDNAVALGDWSDLYNEFLASERAMEAMESQPHQLSARGPALELSMADLSGASAPGANRMANLSAGVRPPSGASDFIAEAAAEDLVDEAEAVEEELLRRLGAGDETTAPGSSGPAWPPQHYAALQPPHYQAPQMQAQLQAVGCLGPGFRSSAPAPLPPSLARPQPFSPPTAVAVPGSLAVSRQSWQAPASVPAKPQAAFGVGCHPASAHRDSGLRASVPTAAFGAAGVPEGWVTVNTYGRGPRGATAGVGPQPTTALCQAMGMRSSPVRTSAPAPLGGRTGAQQRDVSPGSMTRPSRGQPSSYAAIHTQRQNSPPHARVGGMGVSGTLSGAMGVGGDAGGVGVLGVGSSMDREEMFEALHRGLSPHRLRAMYPPPGADGAMGPGGYDRQESGPGGSYVAVSAQQQQFPPYQNQLQRIENWAAAAAARSAAPQPAMYMTAAGPRASPMRQSAPLASGAAATAQRGLQPHVAGTAGGQVRGGQGTAGVDVRASAPMLTPRQAAAHAGGRAASPTGIYRPPGPQSQSASGAAGAAQERRAPSRSWNEGLVRPQQQHPASVSSAATAGSSVGSTATGHRRPSQQMQPPLPPQSHLAPRTARAAAAAAAGFAAGAAAAAAAAAAATGAAPTTAGSAEPVLLEQLARRTPSPVEPRSPNLFISPQAYREYAAAAGTTAGAGRQQQQQQPGSHPATAPAAAQVPPSAGMTPTHGVEGAGLEAGGFTAHGIRGMQRRLAAGLEEAAAERDRGRKGAGDRSPGRELRGPSSVTPAGAVALRPPDMYDDGVMQPYAALLHVSTSGNDMSAALEGGASPYTLAAAAAAAAIAAAQRSDAVAARQGTRSSGGGAVVGSGSLFESPSFGGPGLMPPVSGPGAAASAGGGAVAASVTKGIADLDEAGLEALDAEFEFYEAISASRQGTQGGFGSLGGAAAGGAAVTPGAGAGVGAARTGTRALSAGAAAGSIRASWPSPSPAHQSPASISAMASGAAAAAAAAAANGGVGRPMVASSTSGTPWRGQGAGVPPAGAPALQGGVAVRASPSASGGSAAVGTAAPGPSGISAAALSAAAAAVVATALRHTRSPSMSDTGSSGGSGGVGGSALTPGPSAVLDTAALTAQLSRLDAASLEAIRGYASGYIDGRVQAMPQFGQVRSQVVKAAVLRLVDEALAARQPSHPSSQPQPHLARPVAGVTPVRPASAAATLMFVPVERVSPGEERLPAVDLDQAARLLPRHSAADSSSAASAPPRPGSAFLSSPTRAGVAAALLAAAASETGSSMDGSPVHGSGGRRVSGSRGNSSPKSSALVTEGTRSSGGRRKRVSWHSTFDGPPGTLPSSAGADGADAAAAAASAESGALDTSAVDLVAAAAAAAVAAERASLEEAGMLNRASDTLPHSGGEVSTGTGHTAAAEAVEATAPAAAVVVDAVPVTELRLQSADALQPDGAAASAFNAAAGQPAFGDADDQPRAPGPRQEPPRRRLSLAERIAAQLSNEEPAASAADDAPAGGADAAGSAAGGASADQAAEGASTAPVVTRDDANDATTAGTVGRGAADSTQQGTGALAAAAAASARAQLHDALTQRHHHEDVATAAQTTTVAAAIPAAPAPTAQAAEMDAAPTSSAALVLQTPTGGAKASVTPSGGAVTVPTALAAPRESGAVAESPVAIATNSSITGAPAPKAPEKAAEASPMIAGPAHSEQQALSPPQDQHQEQTSVAETAAEASELTPAEPASAAAAAAAATAADTLSTSGSVAAAAAAAAAFPTLAAGKEDAMLPAAQQLAQPEPTSLEAASAGGPSQGRPVATSSSADGYLTHSPGSTSNGSDGGAAPGLPPRASTSSGSGAPPAAAAAAPPAAAAAAPPAAAAAAAAPPAEAAAATATPPMPVPGSAKLGTRTGPHPTGASGPHAGGSARKLGASPPGYQPQTHMLPSSGVTSPGLRVSASSPTITTRGAAALAAGTARAAGSAGAGGGGGSAGGGGGITLSRPAGQTFTSPPQSPASMRPSKLQTLSSGSSARAVQSSGGAPSRHAAPGAGAGTQSSSSQSSGGAGPHPYQPASPPQQLSISNKVMSIVSPTASASGPHPVRTASRSGGGRDTGNAGAGALLSEQLRHDSLKFVRQLEAAIAAQAAEAAQAEAQSAQAAIRGVEQEEQAAAQVLEAAMTAQVESAGAEEREAAAVGGPADGAPAQPDAQHAGGATAVSVVHDEQVQETAECGDELDAGASALSAATAAVQPAPPLLQDHERAPAKQRDTGVTAHEAAELVASSGAADRAAATAAAAMSTAMDVKAAGAEVAHVPHGAPTAASEESAASAHADAEATAVATPAAPDAAVSAAPSSSTGRSADAESSGASDAAGPMAAAEANSAAAQQPSTAEPAAAGVVSDRAATEPATAPAVPVSHAVARGTASAAQEPQKGHAEVPVIPAEPEPTAPAAPADASANAALATVATMSQAAAPAEQHRPQSGAPGSAMSAAQGGVSASSPAREGAPRGVTLTHWRGGSAGGASPTGTSAKTASGTVAAAAGETSSPAAAAAPAGVAAKPVPASTSAEAAPHMAAAAKAPATQEDMAGLAEHVERSEAPKSTGAAALLGAQAEEAAPAVPKPSSAPETTAAAVAAAVQPAVPASSLTVPIAATTAEPAYMTAAAAETAAAAPSIPAPSPEETAAADKKPAPEVVAPPEAAEGAAARPATTADAAAAATAAQASAPAEGSLKPNPSLKSVASAADTPDGSGTSTPTQRRSGRDARSIEPVLAELKTVKAAIAAGDADGSNAARMAELLEQLDSYRRGVERKHGPAHSIATQLRILHTDMSKWLRTNTAASTATAATAAAAAAPGVAAGNADVTVGSGGAAPAAAGSGGARMASGGSSSSMARGFPPALEAVPEAAASEPRPLPSPQGQPDQQQQHWAAAGAVGRRESQSSVHTDATFDAAGGANASTAASTPRDSIADGGGGGFSFPSHQAAVEQPRGSAGGFHALPQPARPSGSGAVGVQHHAVNGGAGNRGVSGGGAAGMPAASMGGMPHSTSLGQQGMGPQMPFAAVGMAGAGGLGHAGMGMGHGGVGTGHGGGMGMGMYGPGGGMAQAGMGGHMGMAGAGMTQPVMPGMGAMVQPGAAMMQPGAAMAGGMGGGGLSLMELANQLNSMAMQQHALHGPGAGGGGGTAGAPAAVFMPVGMRATMPARSQEISAAAAPMTGGAGQAVTAVQRAASATARNETLQQSQPQKKSKSKWGTLFGKK
ncbi:hypothetical protein HYH02_002748 [Chlamydomonas schloesseri]|uniref:Uncharacterized protein n=1 Tax=Chlamydomonas schloesseri TaxID=2026947 RepID=A0A835WSB9_9CHLO|nr:hypothetical protein HYH02_002748 [Chlamydomonas schloesseri]|eukprot:KAG2452509.1 hypothetical protein HYH02_002748 [Chlamydomonas schloesseri]